MKQALVEGAVPIPGISMYEQGQGKLDLARSKVTAISDGNRSSDFNDAYLILILESLANLVQESWRDIFTFSCMV